MNLGTKLWLLIVASTVTGVIVLLGLIWVLGEILNEGYTHMSLRDIGATFAEQAELAADTDRIEALIDETAVEHPDIAFEWFSANGELMHASTGRTDAYSYAEQMDRFVNMPFNLWETGEGVTMAFRWLHGEAPQYLVMTVPDDALLSRQVYFYMRDSDDLIWFLLPMVLFTATPYVFAVYFFGLLKRRLVKLNSAMRAVDARESAVIVDDTAYDEIGELARHFNTMSKRIAKQVTQIQEYETKRKTLIANISHDLRTPMTMIQGYAETLHAGLSTDEEERKRHAEIILRRSRYMDQLLQKLLEISRLDASGDAIRIERTNLSELMRKITADYVNVLENAQIDFEISVPEAPVMADVDAHLIERAARNLIENAIQYGGQGRYLGIVLDVYEPNVSISVIDHGPGIPEDQQASVFDRFYRGSGARAGDGIGIGLSIVQGIAVAHGGSVSLRSQPGETIFSLRLPLKSGRI